MESRRQGSNGLGELSWTAFSASAYQLHSSHDTGDSETTSAINASTAATGNHHHHTQSIAFATSDHGIVGVNLTELSNALGVRRSDVVPQRLTLQTFSAPSRRIDRSLLGSTFGSSGVYDRTLATTTAGTLAVAPTTREPRISNPNFGSTSTVATVSNAAAALAPPLVPRLAPYPRRDSTLRGNQLGGDLSVLPIVSVQASTGLPPLSSSLPRNSNLSSQKQQKRWRGSPPPYGANALRRALAGGAREAMPAFAGSVPSPLWRSGGLLTSLVGSDIVPPSPYFSHSTNDNNPASVGGGGPHRFRDDDKEESDGNNERSVLLAKPSAPAARNASSSLPPPTPLATASAVQDGDRTSIFGRRSSASTVASRSASAPTPPPSPLRMSATLADGTDNVAGNATDSAPSPSRSVHFSENVIESISVARSEDEYMRLLVVYSRPWYAYVLLVVFGLLLGFAFLSSFYLEKEQKSLKDRAMSVPFLFFLITGSGAVGVLLQRVVVWRPGSEGEKIFFEDSGQRGQLLQLWALGLIFTGGLTTSLVFSRTISTTVAVVAVIGLVGHLVAESVRGHDEGGDCVTCWDVVGAAVMCLGALLTAASGVIEQLIDIHSSSSDKGNVTGEDFLVLLGWNLSVLIVGVCWTLFTRRLRELSQQVSQQLLLTSSLSVCTAVLGISAYVIDVVLSSDAAAQTSRTVNDELVVPLFNSTMVLSSEVSWHQQRQRKDLAGVLLPCYVFFPDVVILLCGGLSFLLCWCAYHTVSFYVDQIASGACMTVGATLSNIPLVVLLATNAWSASTSKLWATLLGLSVGGALALVLGAGMVIYGGVKYRREVEIRIVVG